MNILDGIRAIPQTFVDVISSPKQSGMRVVLKLSDLRNDPDFFQKVFQVAFAALNLIISQSAAAASLSRLSFVFHTVNMHDFYFNFTFFRKILFFPNLTPRTIDEFKVRDSLVKVIRTQIAVDVMDDAKVLGIATECVKNELESMEKAPGGVSYTDEEEFKDVLQIWVRKQAGLENISLAALDVARLPVSPLSLVHDFVWVFIELGCAGLYLQEWNLLDTAKYAEKIGGFATQISLLSGVYVLLTTGFALKLCEAVRKLNYDAMTVAERNRAKWDIFTSIFEFSLYGLSYLNSVGHTAFKNSTLLWLTVIAKSFGLISIAVRPKHQFFMDRTLPNVAVAG